MAYLNLETMDILEKEHPDEASRAAYFECDEEMAGIIRLLNRKGYRTRFCCSGHLYDEISDTLVEENEALSEEELRELYPGLLKIDPLPDGSRRLTLRQNLSLKSYIVFVPEILLPSVPREWRLDRSVLSHNYYWDTTFTEVQNLKELKEKPFLFYRRRAELLGVLYEWAEALPVYDEAAALDPDSAFRKAADTNEMMRQTYREGGPLL